MPTNPSSGVHGWAQAFGLAPAGYSRQGLPQYAVRFGQQFEVVTAALPVEAMPVAERAAFEVHRVAGQPPHPDRAVMWGAVLEALAADFLAGRALEVVARNLHGH